MDKSIPTKVIRRTAKWYSLGYTPSFIECPNCKKSLGGPWYDEKTCRYCNQKILWD